MTSVKALAAQKLNLFLDTLKADAIQNSHSQYVVRIEEDDKFPDLKDLTFKSVNSDEIAIKTNNKIWIFKGLDNLLQEREGLGESGEIYLVGQDKRIKSASRHMKDWKGILVQNQSVNLGLQNKSGVHQVKDYRGIEVVSAYGPFQYDDLDFVLLSEIDKEEVLSPMKELFPRIFLLCSAFCFLTLVFAFISTRKISGLIDQMRMQINNFHLKMINAMEEEKKRMSYNLHDGVGQILTAIKWGISQEEKPEKLKDLCNEAFKEIRSISDNLMPAVLTEFGFFSAIREYVTKQSSFFNISFTYRFSEQLSLFEFREGMDVNLYRMIQELVHNTIKHSRAKNVSLVLLKEETTLLLRYEDDGIGMEDHEPMPRVLLYRSEIMGATIKRNKIAPGLVYQIEIPMKGIFNEYV